MSNFNVHPIFVHFPIALLTIYTIFELIRFRKIKNLPYWFFLKAVLVIIGSLGILAALQTGDLARHLLPDGRTNPIVRVHENWSKITAFFYAFLAGGYLVAWIRIYLKFQPGSVFEKLWQLIIKIQMVITETPLVIFLAIAGFLALSITGALGGSIVYGFSSDPFTAFIGRVFFGQ